MDHWDLLTTDIQPHQPQILQSDRGEGRAIAITLPAGEQLQDHEVHERAYLMVVDGEGRQNVTQLRALRAARVRQGRVRLPLEAPLGVERGLAVADQDEPGRLHSSRAPG